MPPEPRPPDRSAAPSTSPSPDAPFAPGAPPSPGPASPQTAAPVLGDLERKLAATVLAESEPGGGQDEGIAWVYYTFVKERNGGEEALNRSSAFRLKQPWFKVWMVALGDKTYANHEETFPGYGDVPVALKDFVASNYFQQKGPQGRANKMVATIRKIYSDPSKNPHPDVTNQGSAGYNKDSDFNRDDNPWKQARLYHWLKQCSRVEDTEEGLRVKILPATKKRFQTVLINANAIAAYFKKHPEQLQTRVPKYSAQTDRKPPCTQMAQKKK